MHPRKNEVRLITADEYKMGYHYQWEVMSHLRAAILFQYNETWWTSREQLHWLEWYHSQCTWAEAHAIVLCNICAEDGANRMLQGEPQFAIPTYIKEMILALGTSLAVPGRTSVFKKERVRESVKQLLT